MSREELPSLLLKCVLVARSPLFARWPFPSLCGLNHLKVLLCVVPKYSSTTFVQDPNVPFGATQTSLALPGGTFAFHVFEEGPKPTCAAVLPKLLPAPPPRCPHFSPTPLLRAQYGHSTPSSVGFNLYMDLFSLRFGTSKFYEFRFFY